MAYRWQMQVMADRLDSEKLRGFCDGQTDRQTDGQTGVLIKIQTLLAAPELVHLEVECEPHAPDHEHSQDVHQVVWGVGPLQLQTNEHVGN